MTTEEKSKEDGYNADTKYLEDLVEHTFNTKDEKMSQMTRLSNNQPLPLAMVEMVEFAASKIAKRLANGGKRDPEQPLFSEVFRMSLYKHRRSLNADLLMHAVLLAQDQMAAKMEEGEKFVEPKDI